MKKLLLIIAGFIPSFVFSQWLEVFSYEGPTLTSIECISTDTAFAAGDSSILFRTFNGGITWDTVAIDFLIRTKDMNIPTANTGYMVGLKGKIAKTFDGGDTWELIETDTNYTLREVEFINADTGWVIGNEMNNLTGIILRTFDKGQTWDYNYTSYYHLDIEMLDPIKGLIGIENHNLQQDDYGFLRTIDAGNTWFLSNSDMNAVESISFINGEIGFCLGLNGPVGGLLKSFDGGETWIFIKDEIGGYSRNRTIFITDSIGYYCGWEVMFDGGKISKTEDGGVTWQDQISGRFWDMDMINIDTGYALTWDGKIYKTINGGWVGVEENAKSNNDFSIYPNPFYDKLFIESNEKSGKTLQTYNLNIIDLFGRMVYSKTIDNKCINCLNTEIIPSGTYFYKIQSGKFVIQSGKFVKTKK